MYIWIKYIYINIFLTHYIKSGLILLMRKKRPSWQTDAVLSALFSKKQDFLSEPLVALFGLTQLKHHASLENFKVYVIL